MSQGEHSLLELTVLVLTQVWLLSFFSTSLFPGIPHKGKGAFTDVLTVVIVLLIMFRFLT